MSSGSNKKRPRKEDEERESETIDDSLEKYMKPKKNTSNPLATYKIKKKYWNTYLLIVLTTI